MKVSVIIPTYNAEPYLTKLLENLKQQTLSFELIIIDSSSTDNTLTIAKQYTDHIISILKNEFDHGGSRTLAAKVATGNILIFITQDALPTSTISFENLLQVFSNPMVAAAYGRQLAYEETNFFGKHLRLFNYPKTSSVRSIKEKNLYGMKTAFLSDSFSAYRKSAMKEVDYFDDGLIVGEDNHITAKLLVKGYKVAYVADAEVYHSHSYNLLQEFQRYFDIGVFHTTEYWILETFGKAEGEGNKYIKSQLAYLMRHKAYIKFPEFILRNGLKYLGYKLGRNYRKLSPSLRKKCSMHTSWWEKK